MALLKNYLETYQVGLKEFNNMVMSKITQLRSERTKTIYQYFHNSILPAMSVLEPKMFKAIVKSLSQVYRNKDIDVEDTISQIEPLLVGGKPSVDTRTPSPSQNIPDPLIPESPSHKVVEKKKKAMKKCAKSPKDKEMVKKLVKALKPSKEETESEADTE